MAHDLRSLPDGILGNRPDSPNPGGAPLFDTSASFIHELRTAGYRTGLFGKYLNATDLLEEVPPGWDRWEAFVGDAFNLSDYGLDIYGLGLVTSDATIKSRSGLVRKMVATSSTFEANLS